MKEWWKSKTLWFNGICGLFAAAESATGLLKPFIGQEGYVALMVLLPTINVMLRFATKEGLVK